MRRRTIVIAGVVLAVAASMPSGAADLLHPLVVDWPQHFRLEWSSGERNGRPVVSGQITGTSKYSFRRIQLLIDGLGPNDAVTSQQVEWLSSEMPAGTHLPFEVRVRQPAARYRVSVYAFEFAKRSA